MKTENNDPNHTDTVTFIENELWNIFSYYSLHMDPMKPEALKTSTFIIFAKDSQIIPANSNDESTGLLSVELEVMKFMNLKRNQSSSLKRSDGRVNQTLTFSDFIDVLGILAPVVYPSTMHDSTTSIRRLLLENILLLSNRRHEPQNNDKVALSEVLNWLLNKNSGLTRSLFSIFNYYANITATHHRHRNHSSNRKGTDPSVDKLNTIYSFNNPTTATIGYQECMQFALDFNIRASPLLPLTIIQLGDIFLRCIELDSDTLLLKGMNFESFVKMIITLAAVAYRDCISVDIDGGMDNNQNNNSQTSSSSSSFLLLNKTKALLLHMWKSVVNIENNQQHLQIPLTITTKGSPTLSQSHSSSASTSVRRGLNSVASSDNRSSSRTASHSHQLFFREQFLILWKQDGFSDYVCENIS